MKSKYLSLASLKHKLLNPCKKMVVKFLVKLRPRKPLSIKSLHLRRRGRRLFGEEREMDRMTELTSFSDAAPQHKVPHPSPLTPAYIRMSTAATTVEEDDHDRVEEACKSFEKYVVEMIVDKRKVRDLGDVEELLHCWMELRSPVFLDLVCRFYRELCTDLFSTNHLGT
ncbi:transcription repressor OFP17-like [Salvia divinorum]|uniref:Transcription repressor OFP17-like n=1 Tax=Salvia divinorum TaxID=28513 RepID=A0ABD1GLT1_SALDI